jgi:hypothetical protein
MKVELAKPAEVVKFNPIAITITIESQEEYEAIKKMAWHNASIPDLLEAVHRPHVESFLTDLYCAITKDRD